MSVEGHVSSQEMPKYTMLLVIEPVFPFSLKFLGTVWLPLDNEDYSMGLG